MTIERGDLVVTPDGKTGPIVEENPTGWRCYADFEVDVGEKVRAFEADDLVKLNAPIRVRVSNEAEAECLVALARECGFEDKYPVDCYGDGTDVWFNPDKKVVGIEIENEPNLTFESDYAQIKSWIEAHGESEGSIMFGSEQFGPEFKSVESEDECERCGGSGEVLIAQGVGEHPGRNERKPCPNCTDDSSEPREFERIRKLCHDSESHAENQDRFMAIESVLSSLKQKWDDFEEQLEDVREERDGWKKSYESLLKRLDDKTEELLGLKRNLRRSKERIEEARMKQLEVDEKLSKIKGLVEREDSCIEAVKPYAYDIQELLDKQKELLTPDSDEEDGNNGT